ncbi:MAG: hypothetical protein Q9218_007257 [Villophora microphyllina]
MARKPLQPTVKSNPKTNVSVWTADERQFIVDGIIRGQSKKALGAIINRNEKGVATQVRAMTGAIKRKNNGDVFLPGAWGKKDDSDAAGREFGWEEDAELVKWLFNGCTGFDGKLLHDSRTEDAVRRRLVHIQDAFEKLSDVQIQTIFDAVNEALPSDDEIDWQVVAMKVSSQYPDVGVTPALCCAVFCHGCGVGIIASHPDYKKIGPQRPKGPPKTYPQGPPAEPYGPQAIFNDPELISALRLNVDEGDKRKLLAGIPITNVTKVQNCYPAVDVWVYGKEMSEENKKLWDEYALAPKKDGRRVFGVVKELDESRLRGVIKRGQNAHIQIDGELSLFILRDAVQHRGVLEYLSHVGLWNCNARRTCRRDDPGKIVQIAYTCSAISNRKVIWSRSLLATYSEEETRKINLRDSSAWGLLWNIVKALIPDEVVEDFVRVIKEHGIPTMDCDQDGKGAAFPFVVDIDGKQHVLTGLQQAPTCGFSAINYTKDTHSEIGDTEFVISLTTDSDMSVGGGRFYCADAGYIVEREPNTLMVHRTRHRHGSELLDIAPSDQKPYSWGMSICVTETLCDVWRRDKEKKAAFLLVDTQTSSAAPVRQQARRSATPSDAHTSSSASVVSSPCSRRASALKRGNASEASQPPAKKLRKH